METEQIITIGTVVAAILAIAGRATGKRVVSARLGALMFFLLGVRQLTLSDPLLATLAFVATLYLCFEGPVDKWIAQVYQSKKQKRR